jgi:hypothetical protein
MAIFSSNQPLPRANNFACARQILMNSQQVPKRGMAIIGMAKQILTGPGQLPLDNESSRQAQLNC